MKAPNKGAAKLAGKGFAMSSAKNKGKQGMAKRSPKARGKGDVSAYV